MIIDITKKVFSRGKISSTGTGMWYNFFPTANAAYRKKDLIDIGGFDENLFTGEDVDVCIRMHQAKKVLWFESSAKVYHRSREDFKGLVKQWWGYGFYHPFLYRKYGKERRITIYRYNLKEGESEAIKEVFSIPSGRFTTGALFISPLLKSFAYFFLLLLSLLLPAPWLYSSVIFAGLLLYELWYYLGNLVEVKHPWLSLQFMSIRVQVFMQDLSPMFFIFPLPEFPEKK
jgi:cellulose synthase/poly-beta-1,6-N-acetylglucosamine synthase-like glycosyltransferase